MGSATHAHTASAVHCPDPHMHSTGPPGCRSPSISSLGSLDPLKLLDSFADRLNPTSCESCENSFMAVLGLYVLSTTGPGVRGLK